MTPLAIISGAVVVAALVVHLAVSRALYGQRLHRIDRAFTSARKPRA